jgi:hypothetical protein
VFDISCLLVKRGGSLSFLTIFTFAVPEGLVVKIKSWSGSWKHTHFSFAKTSTLSYKSHKLQLMPLAEEKNFITCR